MMLAVLTLGLLIAGDPVPATGFRLVRPTVAFASPLFQPPSASVTGKGVELKRVDDGAALLRDDEIVHETVMACDPMARKADPGFDSKMSVKGPKNFDLRIERRAVCPSLEK